MDESTFVSGAEIIIPTSVPKKHRLLKIVPVRLENNIPTSDGRVLRVSLPFKDQTSANAVKR